MHSRRTYQKFANFEQRNENFRFWRKPEADLRTGGADLPLPCPRPPIGISRPLEADPALRISPCTCTCLQWNFNCDGKSVRTVAVAESCHLSISCILTSSRRPCNRPHLERQSTTLTFYMSLTFLQRQWKCLQVPKVDMEGRKKKNWPRYISRKWAHRVRRRSKGIRGGRRKNPPQESRKTRMLGLKRTKCDV